MLGSVRRLSRVLAGAALLGATVMVPLQAVIPRATAPAAAAGYDACGVVLAKGDGTSWTCSFVDNFDGGSLDTNKWITQRTARTGFRTGQTCYTSSDKNIKVRRGVLELVARDEGRVIDCSSPQGAFTTRYTGGLVSTRGKFSQAYGRFEVRAKYPAVSTAGLHGGFWMYPLNHTYGQWPASGEIDVAEWWSNQPTLVLPSLHFNGRDRTVDSGWNCRVADASSYHTYAVEWLPTEIRFFIDGSLCFARTWTPDSPLVAPQPFDHPFSMILNMGVGALSGTNAVSAITELPATYTVDYAKAWR